MENKSNPNSVLFVICLSSVLVPFMSSALNLALPRINEDLSINAVTSGWIQASYMLSTAIFQIPCARIADMVGRRKIFTWGVLIFTIFSFISCFAFSGFSLVIYRFFSGIGSAMMFGTGMAILTASVSPEKRGWALGINVATVYFSLASGPFFGGILTQYFNWHSIFLVAAIIGVMVIIGSFLFIKEEVKPDQTGKFDYIGSLLYAVGLSSIIYGFSQLPHLMGFGLLTTGPIILFFFFRYEQKQEQPVFDVNVFFGNRLFKLSSVAALINYAATFAISFMLSLYLQYVRGLQPRDAGLILIVQSLFMAIVSLVSGRMSDKVSPAVLATTGMSIILAGLIGLCFITESSSLYLIIMYLALLGLGFGIFSSPNTNMIMSSVEKKHYSQASAVSGTMRLTGQAFSMGIAMMAISLQIGNAPLSYNVHTGLINSMRITFIICSVLCVFGIYASSVRSKK